MIEALPDSFPLIGMGGFLGSFLGSLFGGGDTEVTTTTDVDIEVLVAPEIGVDVDVDVDTGPIATALADLGEEQAALFVAALGGQTAALSQQAVAQAGQAAAI